MTAERDSILTTIRPADRIPSVGVQLTVEPWCLAHDLPASTCAPRGTHVGGPFDRPAQPERLTLWDQPADLWSTDR